VTTFDSRLLTPPKEEEEIYPYRRVWFSIIIENSLLFSITIGIYVLMNFIGVTFPVAGEKVTRIFAALLPAMLWFIFSWWAEQIAPEPRQNLLSVFFVSALVASAIGQPVIETIFEVDRWLPTTDSITRIIGYTFTVGITQETLKYLIVRYIAWPAQYRIRIDSVAFVVASAIGYSTAINLQTALTQNIMVDLIFIRVFNTTTLHVATAIIIAYGLSEIRFGQPFILLPAITVGLAALLAGFVIPFRTGLTNASFSLHVSASNPILGFLFSTAILVGIIAAFSFLYNVADRDAA